MKKRVLALMLALVMALSLLPMMVAAEGEAHGGVNVETLKLTPRLNRLAPRSRKRVPLLYRSPQ